MDTNQRAQFRTVCSRASVHPIRDHQSGSARQPAGSDVGQPPKGSPTRDRLVLTVDEAAYLLNISRGLVYELVSRGELPAIRLGRRIVIPRIAMEELLGTAIQ
jgi:excisionase family DNA binding protein